MTTTSVPIPAPTLAELVDRLDDAVRAPGPGLDVPHADDGAYSLVAAVCGGEAGVHLSPPCLGAGAPA